MRMKNTPRGVENPNLRLRKPTNRPASFPSHKRQREKCRLFPRQQTHDMAPVAKHGDSKFAEVGIG